MVVISFIFVLRMGRKTTMYVGGLLLIAAAFAVSWAPEIISFTVLEFIIGGTNHGSFLCANVLGKKVTKILVLNHVTNTDLNFESCNSCNFFPFDI